MLILVIFKIVKLYVFVSEGLIVIEKNDNLIFY